MENKENISGYEKYSQLFEEIEKKLDNNNFVGIEDVLVCVTEFRKEKRENYKHFIFNGLHVYTNGVYTFISDGEYNENKAIIERYKSDTHPNLSTITLKLGHGFGNIVYGQEGRNIAGHLGEGRDYSFLPTKEKIDNIRDYENAGNFSSDLSTILESAEERAEDDQTRIAYSEALELDDRIEDTYTVALVNETRKDIQKNGIDDATKEFLDEYLYPKESRDIDDESAEGLTESEKVALDEGNIDRQNDDKMFSRVEDFTPDELEQMDIEDLDNMLRSTEIENDEKRKELEGLRKKQLILQIKNAIEEGKELDSRIAEARTNNIENR